MVGKIEHAHRPIAFSTLNFPHQPVIAHEVDTYFLPLSPTIRPYNNRNKINPAACALPPSCDPTRSPAALNEPRILPLLRAREQDHRSRMLGA